jgi:hypothetical protein
VIEDQGDAANRFLCHNEKGLPYYKEILRLWEGELRKITELFDVIGDGVAIAFLHPIGVAIVVEVIGPLLQFRIHVLALFGF